MSLPSRSRHLISDGASLRDLLASIVADCCRSARERGLPAVAVTLDAPGGQPVPAAAAPLRRLLESLLRRAVESAAGAEREGDAPLMREVLVTSVDMDDCIEIEVADSGAGLPRDVRAWLAGQGDETPAGAGLALAAVRAAADRIGGTVRAVDCPEGGVAVTLRLPRRQAQRLAA
jgi:signal transduction histidine kinase